MQFLEWRVRMEAALAQLRTIDLGYPQGENVVQVGAEPNAVAEMAAGAGIPLLSPLVHFYRHCGGVSLPDVHVGYFVHPPELVVRGRQQGEPQRLTGTYDRAVIVFGSDGGGGRFVIGTDGDGEVLYLGEGRVEDAVYDGWNGDVRVLSESLNGFLDRLLADVEAFICPCPGWRYLV